VAWTPVELVIDLAVEADFDVFFLDPLSTLTVDDESIRFLLHPQTAMTFSDTGAHVSQCATTRCRHTCSLTGCENGRPSPWRRRFA
jgi:hypothetical protein